MTLEQFTEILKEHVRQNDIHRSEWGKRRAKRLFRYVKNEKNSRKVKSIFHKITTTP